MLKRRRRLPVEKLLVERDLPEELSILDFVHFEDIVCNGLTNIRSRLLHFGPNSPHAFAMHISCLKSYPFFFRLLF